MAKVVIKQVRFLSCRETQARPEIGAASTRAG